jgi:hypothetical protein
VTTDRRSGVSCSASPRPHPTYSCVYPKRGVPADRAPAPLVVDDPYHGNPAIKRSVVEL